MSNHDRDERRDNDRPRLSSSDPVNTTLPHGQQAATSNFGAQRDIAEAQRTFGDQLQQLEGEKISLMKRLNMVLSELEKGTHDKSDIAAKLRQQERLAEELKHKLEEVSGLKNVVNRNLQDDLKYEVDMSKKLRDELDRFEREKDMLLKKLKEEEDLSEQIARETNTINNNLMQRTDDLKKLEYEHSAGSRRFQQINDELEALRGQEIKTRQQKVVMDNQLHDLTDQRNDLIKRMNELSERYETYVSTMNRERSDICRQNKHQIKHLVAKLLVQIIQENIQRKRKMAFLEISSTARQVTNLERKWAKLGRIVSNYHTDRKRHYIRLWYRKAFNCMDEIHKRNIMLEKNVKLKREQKFFYLWRQEFLKNNKNKFGQAEGRRLIKSIMSKRNAFDARSAICRWRDHMELQRNRESFLYSVTQKKQERAIRRAYVVWLCYVKKENLSRRYEILSDVVTETWFKQRVFLGMKHACQQQKQEQQNEKFVSWKNYCNRAREVKYFEKKQLLVEKLDGQRTERLVKRVFDAMRFCNMQYRFEDSRDILNKKLPEQEELQFRRDALLKNTGTRLKAHVLRMCYLRYCDQIYRAILIWRNMVNFHKHVLNRFKLRCINMHKNRNRIFFMRWKNNVDKRYYQDLLKETEEELNNNQNFKNALGEQKKIRTAQEIRASQQQIDKLERIKNMFAHKCLRRCYDKWIIGAQILNGLERGIMITKKVELRHRQRNGFNKWLRQANAIRRLEFINKKCDWFAMQRQNVTKKDVWFTWARFIKQFKLAKKFLDRHNNGVQRSICCVAFMQWKKVVAKDIQKLFEDNIKELKRRQDEHQKSIKKNQNELSDADNQKHHLIAQMKSLAQKVMANFIARTIHMKTARGFYTWVDETHNWNRRRRILRNSIIHWNHNSLARAFRTWAETNNKMVEQDLKNDLGQKEERRRNLIRQGKCEEAEQEAETERLKNSLKEKIAERDSLLRSFQIAFETHFRRVQNNTYIEKKRNIFGTWREYIRQEKMSVNVIGAIARRTLRIEVFQRIRLAARERWLDKNATRICKNFFRMVLRNNMRQALSKWRTGCAKKSKVSMLSAQSLLEQIKNNNLGHYNRIIKQKEIRAFNVIRLHKLRKYLIGLKEMSKFLKALRVKDIIMKQNILYLRTKRACQLWYQRAELTQMMRRRQSIIIKKYQLKMMHKGWDGLRKIQKDTRLAGMRMKKLMCRMKQLDLAQAFNKWQQWTLAEHEKDVQSKKFGATNLLHIIDRLTRRQIASSIHNLRIRTTKKDFKENFLKRVILHASRYRLRHFFHKWGHKANCIKLAELTEGDVVLRRNEIQRNVQTLRRYLIKAGYTPDQIDNYVRNKIWVQKGNMQRGIISMFFKNSEFNVVPKAYNTWREFVRLRKHARQAARLVLNNIHHPLSGWFFRWKYDCADTQARMQNFSKQQLIDKIIADENLIGATEQRIKRMDDGIDHLAIQRENLLGHYIRGQKLAIALCKNNYLKTVFRAFLRWKRHSQEYENLRLIEQLERTNQMISDLSHHVGKLELINRNLLGENEELRQAALDGIEIAKVVQELTREREALSHDLADRSGTIKKLIEDNNNLSVRLNIAQKEAQQLDMINHQMQQQPDQRDFR